MAHTKAGGKTNQKTNREGKRLGLKASGGEKVKIGSIILRQRGANIFPGEGVKMGNDFTIFSLKAGTVFFKKNKGKKLVSVV